MVRDLQPPLRLPRWACVCTNAGGLLKFWMPIRLSAAAHQSIADEFEGRPTAGGSSAPVQTIAVIGGKGGIGVTNVAVNLAVAMGASNHKVLLMDADLAMGNVDCLLNLQPKLTLADVMQDRCELADVLLPGPPGVSVIPSANGVTDMARLSQFEQARLVSLFSQLGVDADTLLIDIQSGLDDSAVFFARATREVVVVVCDEPTAIRDALTTIRVLSESGRIRRFRIVANQTDSAQHGLDLYAKLTRHTDRHLDVLLDFCGSIPFDPQLKSAVGQRSSVVNAFPRSPAALAFSKLARRVDRWPTPAAPAGHIEFFVERLVQTAGGHR